MPNLYLAGFMGTGKSAVGRHVARRFRFQYLDSDRQIEQACGKSIREIFEEEGEEFFRSLERRFVEEGHPDRDCVVSCGGGLILQPGVLEALKRKGVLICLFASPRTVFKRTAGNPKRPLLNVENPIEKIEKLMREREPLYREAGMGISTENRTLQEVAEHVIRIYRKEAESFL